MTQTTKQRIAKVLRDNIVPEQVYKTVDLYKILHQAGFRYSNSLYHRAINDLLRAGYIKRVHTGVYIKEFKVTDGEEMKCTLDKGINSCEYFNPALLECSNPNKCSFQDLIDTSKLTYEYQRPEKWFEKYYRKN